MKTLNHDEMRNINGGKWKCSNCGRKYWLWIQWLQHQNCYACYGGKAKFCLW